MNLSNRGQVFFSANTGNTITNNAGAETTLINTYAGIKTLPANTLSVGHMLYWRAWGQYTNQITTNQMTFSFKIGSTLITSVATINNGGTVVTNKVWVLEGNVVFNTVGATCTGNLYTRTVVWPNNTGPGSVVDGYQSSITSFDTTVDQTFDFTISGCTSGSQIGIFYGGYVGLLRP